MVALYIALPAYFVGIWNALLGTFVMYFFMWIFLAVVFQLAHVLEDTSMPSHTDNKVDDHWVIHELDTTANFAMKNPFWTRVLGGLNFQVEHHLFPQISHVHYPKVATIVQDVCNEYWVQYHAYRTMRAAFLSHIRYMRQMGQA
jgi:linoleoyl-CoA desaturase